MARRALDYLVGFTLSPVLWRKLPGSRSAGRVQSVALRLVCEREAEIEIFKPQEYWTVVADFAATNGTFTARLTHLNGKKLEKFDLNSQAAAQAAVAAIEDSSFKIESIEHKKVARHPAAPFTTSTLQQEASRKLGFGAMRTMRTAQRLYEGVSVGGETVGLITYMRTDGVSLSGDAIAQARDVIGKDFGANYVPASPRQYKAKAKNAQEAHEAVRPTDLRRHPDEVAKHLEGDEARLYELIWKRTMASQMASAEFDQMTVEVESADRKTQLRATGSVVVFDGFLKLYFEDTDDLVAEKDEEGSGKLPKLQEKESLKRSAVKPDQHFTQPPPRYTEASLVKKLEELGIGRPSTYASIMQVLQERNYVRLEGRAFVPEDRGRIVTAFLVSFFRRYVEYNFTAELEEQLDHIAEGEAQWKKVLKQFWTDFSGAVGETKDLTITKVIDELDADLGPHFFPMATPGVDPRNCPTCGNGRLGLKLGKFGAFIGCSNYPECKYTRRLAIAGVETAESELAEGDKDLGFDPVTGLPVSIKRGPYGIYVQLGPKPGAEETPAPVVEEVSADGKKKKKKAAPKAEKPKRVSLLRGMNPNEIDLEMAMKLLSLPREIGVDPETGDMISAGVGRFGPYLKLGSIFKSIPKDDDVLTIGLNRAVVLLAEAKAKGPKEIRTLGNHPTAKGEITINRGRFGPYLKFGRVMANLPKGTEPDAVTMEQAVALLAAKAAKGGKATAAKKAPAEKAEAAAKPAKKTVKKTTAKKVTAKKTTVKKAAPAKRAAAK